MGRSRQAARRFALAGVIALVGGGALIGVAATTASAKATPAVTAAPDTGLTSGAAVTVDATGFPAKTKLFVAECNSDNSAPTIADGFVKGSPTVSVGCSAFNPLGASKTDKTGAASGTLIVSTGQVGPPFNGTDSSGGSAQTDAANFPCPAVDAGTGCVAEVIDSAGDVATTPIMFVPVTTTTTQPGACSPSGSTTVDELSTVGSGDASVTVSPTKCVSAGTPVTVTATNLLPNDLGSILECNTAANQPTVTFVGTAIPVGCSGAAAHIFTSSASGGESTKFTILAGVIGPPTSGTDSAGHDAAADAKNFPCPPTGSANGSGCAIVVGDEAPAAGPAQGAAQPAAADPSGGDQVVVPVAFSSNPGTSPGGGGGGTSPGGGGGSTSPSGGGGASTAANSSTSSGTGTSTSSGSLAFTGPGAGLWLLAGMGMVLIGFGCLVMAYGDVPRRLLIGATHRGAHSQR